MAKTAKRVEPVDDEFPEEQEYDEAQELQKGDAFAESAKRNPALEPVPEGGVFDGPDPEAGRAEAARELRDAETEPAFDVDEGPDPIQVIAKRREAGKQAAAMVEPPVRPGRVIMPGKAEVGPYFIAQEYGGRFRLYPCRDLAFMQGFSQNLKGTKRLFEWKSGAKECQEINGLGMPIQRQ